MRDYLQLPAGDFVPMTLNEIRAVFRKDYRDAQIWRADRTSRTLREWQHLERNGRDYLEVATV